MTHTWTVPVDTKPPRRSAADHWRVGRYLLASVLFPASASRSLTGSSNGISFFFLVIEHPGWNLDVPWLGWCRSVCSVWIGKPAASFYCSYSRLPSFCLKSAARIISRVARESRLTSVMYVSLRGLTKKSAFPWGRISEMFVVKSMPSFESLKKKIFFKLINLIMMI